MASLYYLAQILELLIILEIIFTKQMLKATVLSLPLQADTPTSIHIYKNAYKHINLLTLFFANIKFSKLRIVFVYFQKYDSHYSRCLAYMNAPKQDFTLSLDFKNCTEILG